ncbi:MAG: class I SAM-dependent methyltransferase, partial [Pseudomonadota bacterium]
MNEHAPENGAKSDDWFTDESFWRTFGPLMFGPDQFSEAERQVDQLLATLGVPKQAGNATNVLDLGCGPGRHALPLARAGLNVTAVDTSGYLLNQLLANVQDQELEIEVLQQDMRSFSRSEQYDLALLMWTSFGYFEDEADHRKVLQNLFESLTAGGRLVLDLVGLEYLCRTLEPVHLSEYDDGRILIERPLLTDHLTRLENEWVLLQTEADGSESVHRANFSHRVWSASEMVYWLKAAGFGQVTVTSDFAGGEYSMDSERLIL